MRSAGWRTFASSNAIVERIVSPFRLSRVGGMRSPSAKELVARGLNVPGTGPPTSGQCPQETA
jgi:hypothetical protein